MNIVHQVTKNSFENRKLNVLTSPVHERAQGMLRHVDATFWLVHVPNGKTWNSKYGELPKNHILIPKERGFWLPPEIEIDVVISQNKFDSFRFFQPLAQRYKIPLISLEHTGPYSSQWPTEYMKYLNSLKGDVNVFITDWSRDAWGWKNEPCDVIYHGIDSVTFKPLSGVTKKPYILSVVNQFSRPERHLPCGYPLWKEVVGNDLPWLHLGGDDPGFSEPAKDINDLVYHYNECSVFINTSQISPIPNAILEAASCAAAICTTSHCDVGNIFEHRKTALISNNPKELREFCVELLDNPTLRQYLGENARKMIIERFGMDRFTVQWNNLLKKAASIRKY